MFNRLAKVIHTPSKDAYTVLHKWEEPGSEVFRRLAWELSREVVDGHHQDPVPREAADREKKVREVKDRKGQRSERSERSRIGFLAYSFETWLV